MAGSGSAEQTLLTTASSNYTRSHLGPMGAPVSLRVDDGALRDQELPWPGALPVVSGRILGGNMPCRGGQGNFQTPSQHLTQAAATQPMQASASKPVQQRALLQSTTLWSAGHGRAGSRAMPRPRRGGAPMARHRVSGAYTMRVDSRNAPSWKGVSSGEAAAAACSLQEPWRARHGPPAWRGAQAGSQLSACGMAPRAPPAAVRAGPPSVSVVGSWRGGNGGFGGGRRRGARRARAGTAGVGFMYRKRSTCPGPDQVVRGPESGVMRWSGLAAGADPF